MKAAAYILILIFVLIGSGCIAPKKTSAVFEIDEDFKNGISQLCDAQVPVPTTTPYESDIAAKEAYLDYFRRSYQEHMNSYRTGVSRTLCSVPEPNGEAKFRGWSDAGTRALEVYGAYSEQYWKDRWRNYWATNQASNETVQRTGASGSAHETNRTSSAAGSGR